MKVPPTQLELPPLSPRARVWVAYSGGLDSTVLLHLLHAQGVQNLRAIHIHHGLQTAADGWARQARARCRALGVPLTVRRVAVNQAGGEGPEAAARAARYAAFAEILRPGDLLATAHHRDDQAETVLLRALRGSGIHGLAAMPVLAPLGAAQLWRPLLALSRRQLRDYAQAQDLRWIDDPHNADPRYARSWLRAELMPRLAPHWPQAADSLARLAGRAAEAAGLLDELAQQDLQPLRHGDALSVAGLLALSPARRRNALYHAWCARWPAPSQAQLQALEREVLTARDDAQPCLRHEHGELRRFRDHLYLLPALPPRPPAGWQRDWPLRRRVVELPDGLGRLQAARAPSLPLRLRFARGGERLRPAGDAHTRGLKALCQVRGLPVWVRERMPLVYAIDGENEELIAIAGYWRNARAAAWGLDLRWQTTLPGAAGAGG